jgi:hypothetical protein
MDFNCRSRVVDHPARFVAGSWHRNKNHDRKNAQKPRPRPILLATCAAPQDLTTRTKYTISHLYPLHDPFTTNAPRGTFEASSYGNIIKESRQIEKLLFTAYLRFRKLAP